MIAFGSDENGRAEYEPDSDTKSARLCLGKPDPNPKPGRKPYEFSSVIYARVAAGTIGRMRGCEDQLNSMSDDNVGTSGRFPSQLPSLTSSNSSLEKTIATSAIPSPWSW